MTSRRRARTAAFVLGALLAVAGAAPEPLAAQKTAGAFEVTVVDSLTGRPLAGSQVRVVGRERTLVTDVQGRARFDGLSPGAARVAVRRPGYRSAEFTALLTPGEPHSVLVPLRALAVRLEGVRVTAEPGRRLTGAAAEFYQRQRRGIGRFFTRDEIDRSRSQQFSDLLRLVPGLRLSCRGLQDDCEARMAAAPASLSTELVVGRERKAENSCPVQYYVDGVYQPHTNVNQIRLDDVENVEVYTHGHGAPARYSARKFARCGVILIWMRASLRP